MQQAISESINSDADAVASGFQAPPGWGNINSKAIQLQRLAEERNANREPPTKSDLTNENKALKEECQCRFPGCPNITCRLYLHGDGSNGHMVHCKTHTLKVNDKCPRCEKKIIGAMQMFR